MAVNLTPSRHLPCGRDPIDVWDHVAAGPLRDHEATCRYCQGVAAEYRLLAGPVTRLVAEAVEAPAALLERVIAVVGSALLAHRYLPLSSPYGPVRVDTTIAATALRYSIDQVPGARARSCQIVTAETEPPGEPPPPPTVRLEVSILAQVGTDIVALTEEIRQLLMAVARQLFGIEVRAVDIEVTDLFAPRPPPSTDRNGRRGS